MATTFLSEKQRQRLSHLPEKIDEGELIQYFTLSPSDLSIIPNTSAPHTKLGFVISLCCLRFIGFVPESLGNTPESVIRFIDKQFGFHSSCVLLEQYGARAQTKSDHLTAIAKHFGFVRIRENYRQQLTAWLLKRALEHDRPTLLLKTATEKLKRDKVIRPTLVHLERLVGSVRDQARRKIYEMLSDILTDQTKFFLDNLLVVHTETINTKFTWLKQRATSHSPESILTTLAKIKFLHNADVNHWDLSILNANRLKILSRLGKCSTNQALQRSVPEKEL